MPCVSVILPVYNCAALVGSALASVFAQTYRDFEVIVVDDGSEDQGELSAALAEWADRIQLVRQPNSGPGRARNIGVALSSGRFLAFLDADDEWLPGKLARQVEYFERYPETGLLHTGLAGAAHSDSTGGALVPPRQAFCELFHTAVTVNTLTVLMPRRVFDEVGGFDERREIHTEDWDLWLRVAARHPIGYLREPLAVHRPGGLMSGQIDRTYVGQSLVIDKSLALCAQACASHRAAPGRCERVRRRVLHWDWGLDRLNVGDRRGAREQLGRALALAPWRPRTALLYVSTFVSDRWRVRARRLVARANAVPPRSSPPTRTTPSSPPKRTTPRTVPSLVHDTLYRRTRRRVIAGLHDLDDAIASTRGDRKRILFEAVSPMNFAVFRPIYERLRTDSRVEIWFATADREVWQPHDVYAPAGITENVVTAHTAAWMKVDAYINADLWDMTWLRRRTRRVHLFHGVAGKYGLDAPVDLAPAIAAFDCLMFPNVDRRGRYVEARLVPDDHIKAALIGYPKVDCLVDGSLDTNAISRALGLDPAVPAVIYAPTWSPYSSLNSIGEEVVERLAAEGLQVLVKLHDRSYDRRLRGSGGIDWARRFSKYDSHPSVRVIRNADGSPFLAVSDAMVSDHSSIAFEYMLLDRPLVIIDRAELIAQAGVSVDKVRRLRSASHVVNSAREVASATVEALRRPHHRSVERRQVAGELFYRPGTATGRALAVIYQLIDLPALDTRPQFESRRALATIT